MGAEITSRSKYIAWKSQRINRFTLQSLRPGARGVMAPGEIPQGALGDLREWESLDELRSELLVLMIQHTPVVSAHPE